MENNNRILQSLKSGIIELWSSKWKVLFLGIYIVPVSYFIKKYIIFERMTLLNDFLNKVYPIVKAIVDIFLEESNFTLEFYYVIVKGIFYGFICFLAMLGLLELVILIGKLNSIQDKISKVEFPNDLIPKYKGKRKDKEKQHGEKLIFEAEGLTEDNYANRIPEIESALRKKKIYRVFQDKLDKAIMYLYCIPNKYAKPINISKDTKFQDICYVNLLLTGSTGSGKSTALLTLMQIFARSFKNGEIRLISYKPTQIFSPFKDTGNYYQYDRAKEGFLNAYKEFEKRMKDSVENGFEGNQNPYLLVIDEYTSFCLIEGKEVLENMSKLLNMAREFNMFLLISANRGDSDLFKLGARDNIHTKISMGNILSEEGKKMFAGSKKNQVREFNNIGEAYWLIDKERNGSRKNKIS